MVVFGWYVVVVGVWLLIEPNSLLGLAGVAETDEVWIRVLGAAVAVVGYYYLAAGRRDDRGFARASVFGRWAGVVVLLVLGVSVGPWQLAVFAGVDLLGSLWTQLTLRTTPPPNSSTPAT